MGRKTWQERTRKKIKEAPHRYVSLKMLESLERGSIGRKTKIKHLRELVAEMVENGEATVATKVTPASKGVAAVITAAGRTTAKIATRLPKIATIRGKMMQWIEKRASGTTTAIPHLTAAMRTQMIAAMARRATTAPEARAALATLEAEGSVTTEAYAGKKYTRQETNQEQKKHLAEMEWPNPTATMLAARRKGKVTARGPTALDLGSGWEGATDGMRQHMRVVGVDMTRQSKGKEAGMAKPDLLMNMAVDASTTYTVVEQVMKRTGTWQEDLCHIHISPNCDPESTLQRIEVTQKRGKGEHAGMQRPEQQERTIQAISRGIKQAVQTDPTISYTVEQPKETALKNHPALTSLPGEVRIVKGCCYGYKWQKPMRIWTNLGKWWKPKCSHEPRWLLKCPHCRECRENKPHKQCLIRRGPHDKRPGAKLPGLSPEASRNRIPTKMAAEWAVASMARQSAMRKQARQENHK